MANNQLDRVKSSVLEKKSPPTGRGGENQEETRQNDSKTRCKKEASNTTADKNELIMNMAVDIAFFHVFFIFSDDRYGFSNLFLRLPINNKTIKTDSRKIQQFPSCLRLIFFSYTIKLIIVIFSQFFIRIRTRQNSIEPAVLEKKPLLHLFPSHCWMRREKLGRSDWNRWFYQLYLMVCRFIISSAFSI